MESLKELIIANYFQITLLAIGISTFTILILILNTWRTGRVLKNYRRLMKGAEGNNLEEMLSLHLEHVEAALAKTKSIEETNLALNTMAQNAIQNVGVVRFNAFEDTGSDLSFAVALLNHHGDGLVLSGLFGRNETRTYAKPVNKGNSVYHLSAEEEEAIKIALYR